MKKTAKKKTTKKQATRRKEVAVVVTTAHRGVFFGYTTDVDANPIALRAARMCVYWSADVRGVVGLAANGPTASCKVTPAADIPSLKDVTGVFAATPSAVRAWEGQPWM